MWNVSRYVCMYEYVKVLQGIERSEMSEVV